MPAQYQPRFNLASKYLLGESGWKPGVDYNFCLLDALLWIGVTGTGAAPAAGTPGQQWIDGSGNVLSYTTTWNSYTPVMGMLAYDSSVPAWLYYDGSAWQNLATFMSNNIVLTSTQVFNAINTDLPGFCALVETCITTSPTINTIQTDVTNLTSVVNNNTTNITNISTLLPPGTAVGDVLVWNGTAYVPSQALPANPVFISTFTGTANEGVETNTAGFVDTSLIDTKDTFVGAADAGKIVRLKGDGTIDEDFIKGLPVFSGTIAASIAAYSTAYGTPGDGSRFYHEGLGTAMMYDVSLGRWTFFNEGSGVMANTFINGQVLAPSPTYVDYVTNYNYVSKNDGSFNATTGIYTAPYAGIINVGFYIQCSVQAGAQPWSNVLDGGIHFNNAFEHNGAALNGAHICYANFIRPNPYEILGSPSAIHMHKSNIEIPAGTQIRLIARNADADSTLRLDRAQMYVEYIAQWV